MLCLRVKKREMKRAYSCWLRVVRPNKSASKGESFEEKLLFGVVSSKNLKRRERKRIKNKKSKFGLLIQPPPNNKVDDYPPNSLPFELHQGKKDWRELLDFADIKEGVSTKSWSLFSSLDVVRKKGSSLSISPENEKP